MAFPWRPRSSATSASRSANRSASTVSAGPPHIERRKWCQASGLSAATCFIRSPASSANSQGPGQPHRHPAIGRAGQAEEGRGRHRPARSPARSKMSWARSRSAAASSIRLRLKLATPALAIAHAACTSSPRSRHLALAASRRGRAQAGSREHLRSRHGVIALHRQGRVVRIVGDEARVCRAASSSPASSCRRARSRSADAPARAEGHGPLEHPTGVGEAGVARRTPPRAGPGRRRPRAVTDGVVGEVFGGSFEMAGPVLRPAHHGGRPAVQVAPDMCGAGSRRPLRAARGRRRRSPPGCGAASPLSTSDQQGRFGAGAAQTHDLVRRRAVPEHGCVLEHQLRRGPDSVEAGRQQRLQRRRDRCGRAQPVTVAVVDQRPTRPRHADQLPQIQRVAPGPLHEEVRGLRGKRLVADEGPRQVGGVGLAERSQPKCRRRRESGQPVAGFAPTDEDQQDRRPGEPPASSLSRLRVISLLRCMSSRMMASGLLRALLLQEADDTPQLFLCRPAGSMSFSDSSVVPASERTRAVTATSSAGPSWRSTSAATRARRSHRRRDRSERTTRPSGAAMPGQLAGQAGLARSGVAAEQRHVGLPVPAHPTPDGFEVGDLVLATQQRQIVARLGGIRRSYGDGFQDLNGLPFALEDHRPVGDGTPPGLRPARR